MTFLDTTYKRKSAVITSIILMLFILCLFVFGLNYFDPPKEYGMAVNFGTSDVGRGKIPTKQIPKTAPSKPKAVEKKVKTQPKVTKTVVKKKVLTQDKIDVPVIAKKITKKATPKKKKVVKKKIPPKPKPDKSTTDVLSKLINGPKNNAKDKKGEGTDTKPGNKGKKEDDLNTKSYYGKGGKGGGGNYNLGDRSPLDTPKPLYDCVEKEEGRVVVSVEVDQNGNVISANAGVKGSTTSAPCLLERAKEAALKTTWQADTTAPSKQIGSITYIFSLSN